MIKVKKCKLCNNRAFSKGYCQTHQHKKNIKTKRLTTKVKNDEKKTKRYDYFEYHIGKCTNSEESFVNIPEPSRVNICHLIDKGRHPSLQDNLDNCIYLTFEEHQRYDLLLFSHRFNDLEKEFKNSWDKTCEKYNYLIPLCKEVTNFTRELKKYLDGRHT